MDWRTGSGSTGTTIPDSRAQPVVRRDAVEDDSLIQLSEGQWRALAEELADLRDQRSEKAAATERVSTAVGRAPGPRDLALRYLEAEVAYLSLRVEQLEDLLDRVGLLDAGGPPDVTRFGSRVTVCWEDGAREDYVLVGPPELSLPSGRIASDSPVGSAIDGARLGDTVVVGAGIHTSRLRIVGVVQPGSERTIPPSPHESITTRSLRSRDPAG